MNYVHVTWIIYFLVNLEAERELAECDHIDDCVTESDHEVRFELEPDENTKVIVHNFMEYSFLIFLQ